QTSNFGGGSVWPLETLRDVAAAARRHGLALHMDGARIMNAAVASGLPAKAFASLCDSAWVDFSKGLGCPVGAALCGSADFIEEAWRWKHQLGGAMRQAGVIAAAAVYALENHVERLAEDHENARRLAAGFAEIPGIRLDPPGVGANRVFRDVSGTGMTPPQVCERMLDRGGRVGTGDGARMRAVTHLDVDRAGIEKAIRALREVVAA